MCSVTAVAVAMRKKERGVVLPSHAEMERMAHECGASSREVFDYAYMLYHGAPVLELAGRPFTEMRWVRWRNGEESAPEYLSAIPPMVENVQCRVELWRCTDERIRCLLTQQDSADIRLFRAQYADDCRISQRCLEQGWVVNFHYLTYQLTAPESGTIELPLRRLSDEDVDYLAAHGVESRRYRSGNIQDE